MVWATVSSWSCFCWQYRASPSLAAKNIINLILVLTIWWCPCVESSLLFWKRVFAMTSAFSWQNSISLCPASFRIPRPDLPVTPGVSWLPTFAFQSPIMKRTSFWGVSLLLSHKREWNNAICSNMDLEMIILSEVSQRKTNIICYLLHVESKKRHKCTHLQNKTDSQTQTYSCQGRAWGWGGSLELADANYYMENG